MVKQNKRLTVNQLKTLLNDLNIKFPSKYKLADLQHLCESKGLLTQTMNDDVPIVPEEVWKEVKKMIIVKCAFRKAMNFDNDKFKLLQNEVETFVHIISRMLRRSSLTMAYHFTKMVASEQVIPNLYDQNDTYWKKWLCIGIDNKFPDKDSKTSFDEISEYIGKVVDPNDLENFPMYFDQVLNYAGHTLQTMITNNAWIPLFSRLARLTKYKMKLFNIKNISTYDVINMIPSEHQEGVDKWPIVLQNYIVEVRQLLKVKQGTRLYDDYGKDKAVDFNTIFRFNYWMQLQFEKLNKKRMKLMPIFGIHRAHVRLDTKTLLFLFKKIYPNDEGILRLEGNNPDKFMFKIIEQSKPEPLLKKNCDDDHQWNDYKTKLQKYQKDMKDIKESESYKLQKQKYDEWLKVDRRNPEFLLNDIEVKKPINISKKECGDDIERWNDYKLNLKKFEDTIKMIKESEAYINQKKKYDDFVRLETKIVSSFFKPRIVNIKKNWNFDGSISTDGVSISIQYSQTRRVLVKAPGTIPKKKQEAPFEKHEYDRNLTTQVNSKIYLGLDPGRNNLACVTYYLANGDKNTWKLSRGAYYNDSGIKKLNKIKNKRYDGILCNWSLLGGENVGLATSRHTDIFAYLKVYSTFSEEWWKLALHRRESRDNLQRYAGKRHVIDSFYSKIKKYMQKKYPDQEIYIAYGSAYKSMKANGKGEVSAPVGQMFSACKRVFKDHVEVTSEIRSTMVSWKYGTKKEIVYKKIVNGKDTFHHSIEKKSPIIKDLNDIKIVKALTDRARIQGKHRKGGTSEEWIAKGIGDPENPKIKKETVIRWPEIRGLRFNHEDGMYLDRDREAALTIARLCCMEKLGLPRPYPFDCRYRL